MSKMGAAFIAEQERKAMYGDPDDGPSFEDHCLSILVPALSRIVLGMGDPVTIARDALREINADPDLHAGREEPPTPEDERHAAMCREAGDAAWDAAKGRI